MFGTYGARYGTADSQQFAGRLEALLEPSVVQVRQQAVEVDVDGNRLPVRRLQVALTWNPLARWR